MAVLEIPALHLFDAVVQGSDAEDLRSGPGHMPTTALPGEPGNAVIAGRRATFGAPFGAIGSPQAGTAHQGRRRIRHVSLRVTRVV